MLNKKVLDVGGAVFSNPTALVPVAKTDSGSTPFKWLVIIQTLLQENPILALWKTVFDNILRGRLYES